MSTGKHMTLSETEEELRQLSWQVRITHDQVLNIAKELPSDLRARAEKTAERLMGFSTTFRRMIAILPAETADLVSSEWFNARMDDVRLSIEETVAEITSVMNELNQIADDLGDDDGPIVH
jgi:hypothetical protein